MFSVQNSSAVDQATISDTGDIAASTLTVTGKIAAGLSHVPLGAGPAITGPAGAVHIASETNSGPNTAFIVQNATNPSTVGGSVFGPAVAPSFSLYRINRYDASNPTTPLAYALPLADNALGYFQFGSIDTTANPNAGSSRKNAAVFYVKAESTWTSVTDTPTYFSWVSTPVGGAFVERMRLSSAGNLGIGTTGTPTSKLQVVGLQVSDAGPPAGLTSGAFYRTSAGVVMVVP
jgi:hypothetical protein